MEACRPHGFLCCAVVQLIGSAHFTPTVSTASVVGAITMTPLLHIPTFKVLGGGGSPPPLPPPPAARQPPPPPIALPTDGTAPAREPWSCCAALGARGCG